MPTGTYYVLKDGDDARGGIVQAPSPQVPTMWLQYMPYKPHPDKLPIHIQLISGSAAPANSNMAGH